MAKTTKHHPTLGVYKMSISYGRMGVVEGVFVAEKEQVKKLIENEVTVYFGEILGKHSEVEITFDEDDDLELITDDPKVIDIIKKYGLSSGYNPFEYLEGDELDGEEEEDEESDED